MKKILLLSLILLISAVPALCQENDYKAPNEVNYEEFEIPPEPLYEEPLQDLAAEDEYNYGGQEDWETDTGEVQKLRPAKAPTRVKPARSANDGAESQDLEDEYAGEEISEYDEYDTGDVSVYGDTADPNSELEESQEIESEEFSPEQN